MTPDTKKIIEQYPIISLTSNPAIANNGSAQNGWICELHVSHQANPTIVASIEAPNSRAASSAIGPCIAHKPPPEGIKKLIKEEL